MQFIARPGTVLVPISQGTEVTIVTEYAPFRYFTRTVSMGTSSITPCYDVERLKTKTHMALGPGESIEYIKHRVSLEGHPWPGCHPESDTWRPYSYGQTKQRGAWTMLVKWTRKDCYLSRKDSGLGVSTNELMIWIRCVWLRWHRKHAVLGGLQECGWEPLHYST